MVHCNEARHRAPLGCAALASEVVGIAPVDMLSHIHDLRPIVSRSTDGAQLRLAA